MSSADIARMIGKSPRRSWDVGEPRKTPKGDAIGGFREQTYCSFEIAKGKHHRLVDAMTDWNRYLLRRKSKLAGLRRTGARFDYFVGIFLNGNGGLVIGSDLLKQMGELGIELGLDMYD